MKIAVRYAYHISVPITAPANRTPMNFINALVVIPFVAVKLGTVKFILPDQLISVKIHRFAGRVQSVAQINTDNRRYQNNDCNEYIYY